MITKHFTFSFSNDDDTYEVRTMTVTGTPEQYLEFETFSDNEGDVEITMDIESDFGVHDVSSTDYEIMGFTTYEVEPDRRDELMTAWREALFDIGGFDIGPVVIMTGPEYEAWSEEMRKKYDAPVS